MLQSFLPTLSQVEYFSRVIIMGLKSLVSSLLLAAPLTVAHPGHVEEVHAHAALPPERKSLNHCEQEFNAPEFVERTVEIHGRELANLRRALGLEVER